MLFYLYARKRNSKRHTLKEIKKSSRMVEGATAAE